VLLIMLFEEEKKLGPFSCAKEEFQVIMLVYRGFFVFRVSLVTVARVWRD
jgi:hypothetical protein